MERIGDLDALVATVAERSPWRSSYLHGERHWQCVGVTGALLAREVPDADDVVVFLFALFHDSQRTNDGWDPQHGARAAALARELAGRAFTLDPPCLTVLADACAGHEQGRLADDPTTAVCWDADRLNLWRVGTRPDPAYLSTEPARRPDWIDRGRDISESSYDWSAVAATFEKDDV